MTADRLDSVGRFKAEAFCSLRMRLPVEAVLMRGAVPCRVVSVVFLTLAVWTLGVTLNN